MSYPKQIIKFLQTNGASTSKDIEKATGIFNVGARLSAYIKVGDVEVRKIFFHGSKKFINVYLLPSDTDSPLLNIELLESNTGACCKSIKAKQGMAPDIATEMMFFVNPFQINPESRA